MSEEKPKLTITRVESRNEAEDCDCKDGMFPDPGRRALLLGGAAFAGAGLLSGKAEAHGPPEAAPGASRKSVV